MTRALFWIFSALPLVAHQGEPLQPHDLPAAWAWDPLILLGLFISAVLYWRGATDEHGFERWERWCYWAGWWSLVLALVSPLHPMGEVLFSAHMAQHEILMLVSAPLLVLGRPLVPYLWGLPMHWRRKAGVLSKTRPVQALWRWITSPFNAWCIHAIALWGWHVPRLFEATVEDDFIHALQHISFLVSAFVFWWALIRGRDAAMGYGMAVVYIFTTAVHSSVLGALLTFSPRVWYPVYASTTAAWGVTPLEDQQLGGLIMWVPAGLVFIAAGLILFAKWINGPAARPVTTALILAAAATLTMSCSTDIDLPDPYNDARRLTGGDPYRGKEAIVRYGCGSCHTIPGIAGATATVGPPFEKLAMRSYVAGVLVNTPNNMERWIKDPPAVDPLTAMPKLGVTDQDARNIVAWLYTLR